jgi:hypothetical protein
LPTWISLNCDTTVTVELFFGPKPEVVKMNVDHAGCGHIPVTGAVILTTVCDASKLEDTLAVMGITCPGAGMREGDGDGACSHPSIEITIGIENGSHEDEDTSESLIAAVVR